MKEFDFISRLTAFSPAAPEGIGDDGAVLGEHIIVKDIMAENIHFSSARESIHTIIERLFISNISDICAMGGLAHGYKAFLGLALPANVDKAAFASAVERAADKYGVLLAGGDTVSSMNGIFLSLTLVGKRGKHLLLRSNARPGDLVCLSRSIGGAAIELQKRLSATPLTDSTGNFPPEQALGELLGGLEGIGACIDISDGLGRDLSHIAQASGVRIILEAERIPLADGAQLLSALCSGEEYALAFSLDPSALSSIPESCTVIGHTEAGAGVFLSENSKMRDISAFGYEHG